MAKLSAEELEFIAKKQAANKARNALRQQQPQGPSRLDTEQRSKWQRSDATELKATSNPGTTELAAGALVDLDFTDLKHNLPAAKKAMKPDQRLLAVGAPQRIYGPGEKHPQAKYSDQTVRLVRAVRRESTPAHTRLIFAGMIKPNTVDAMIGQTGYRRGAVPTAEDYAKAKNLYERHIKDELIEHRELLNYQTREEKAHNKKLRKLGIHPSQLPSGQYDASSAYTKAGDGQPSKRTERLRRPRR
jgi:hypothetical protein